MYPVVLSNFNLLPTGRSIQMHADLSRSRQINIRIYVYYGQHIFWCMFFATFFFTIFAYVFNVFISCITQFLP